MILKLLESDTNKLEGSTMKESVKKSSGNVFLDLGFPPEEAAILQMRSEIMADLRKFITTKKLTQAKAAELLGVSQSRVSDLTRGKWEKFSLEMLIALATKAGMRISLKRAA
jgi:predicted XRE-type DNA-binding protein